MITQEEISKLADEYAEYLSSDNKVNREMIALDCLGFVSGVLLDKYHIVSKEEIKDFHQCDLYVERKILIQDNNEIYG